MMRISTLTQFESGSTRISELQSALAKTQLQVSSGKSLISPSDDPVAAARVLEVSQSKAVNEQYGVNRRYATNTLNSVENTLSSVTSLLQDVKDLVVAAGNPVLSDAERSYQAAELRGRYSDLMGLANSRDEVGDYLFSGFQTNTAAFVEAVPGVVTYQGDAGQRKIQVDASRQVAVTVTGDSVFQGGGADVFQTVNDLITLLETPGTVGLSAGLATANQNLGLSLDNVLGVRASIGAGLKAVDFFDIAGQDRSVQYDQVLSQLQDLDYAKALTTLSQQQTMLEAAQKSFVQTSSLSLFKFI